MQLFFDTETSGLPNWKLPYDHPEQPWVVQLAAVLSDSERIYQSVNLIIKADIRQISEQASNIHGYTTEIVEQLGIFESIACSVFCGLLAKADQIICHNVDFDRLMMQGMMYRQQYEGLEEFSSFPAICTMKSTTRICGIPGPRGLKWPNLQELHQHLFGEQFAGAHDAMTDVLATRRCYYELLKRGLLAPPVGGGRVDAEFGKEGGN